MDSLTFTEGSHGSHYVAEETVAYGDLRPTVYLDTSIPSYLTARTNRDLLIARRQRITRVWWNRYRRNYDLRISTHVLEEASGGDPLFSRARVLLLKTLAALDYTEQSLELTRRLIGNGRLPENAHKDAAHIAIATVHSVRFLLTWNCKHLANATIARNVVRTCETLGLNCPQICTPETLMRAYADGRSDPQRTS